MTPFRRRMIEAMQLRGRSPRTQEAYVRAVRQLAEHYRVSPEQLTDEELRHSFVFLLTAKRWSRSSCPIALCAITFWYEQTLGRPWTPLEFVRPTRQKKLPVVLSVDEVWQIIALVRLPHSRGCRSRPRPLRPAPARRRPPPGVSDP